MSFAAALSEHPITAQAVGEVAGQILEKLGTGPDLALLFVTPPHAGALEDAAKAVQAIIEPATLLGCAAVGVVGNGQEVERTPGVVLWAGNVGTVVPVQLWFDGSDIHGWPEGAEDQAQALLLIGDPFTFPVDQLITELDGRIPIIGGMASAAQGAGGNRLVLDDDIINHGAVGALISYETDLQTVVSQGCRPIGQALTVTRAERNIVYEMGGQAPLVRLVDMARTELSEDDVRLVNEGLHLGLVIDEHKPDFERGDFLIRNVLGGDQENGAIAIGDEVAVGTTVQFHVRDANAADEELRLLLQDRKADGGLLFTCNGRGIGMFGTPDHDASVLAELVGDPPTAGFFAMGELGPVGGRNFMHGFTASVALFRDR
jgi:small ligand-binding sensory domain FIST